MFKEVQQQEHGSRVAQNLEGIMKEFRFKFPTFKSEK